METMCNFGCTFFLPLTQTEITSRPKISSLLSRLANSEYVPSGDGKETETALQKSQLQDQVMPVSLHRCVAAYCVRKSMYACALL